MTKVFLYAVRARIEGLYEGAFQTFIDYLYSICYGSNFLPILQKHDKGSDGLLPTAGTVISVYAPQRYSLAAFKRKADDDFAKYQRHWSSTYPNWHYIYNGEYTAEAHDHLRRLKSDIELISRTYLIDLIDHLGWSEQRKIGQHLTIDDAFFVHNVLDTILEDLLARASYDDGVHSYKPPLYIEDKIRVNYPDEDVDTAIRLQQECTPYFPVLQRILLELPAIDTASIRTKVTRDYLRLSGNFSQRLQYLIEQYAVKHPTDETYAFYVTVVLLFLFEQCAIGKRTVGEA